MFFNENQEIRNIKKFFSNRLVIIDEVHNIRTEDSLDKTVANKLTYKLLLYIAEHAENLRLVLLSATPIYNSPPEIIGLTNLLNVNDRRSKLRERDVFDSKGNLLPHGKELLVRKLTGYISYVRGENPYTFPYRIYPSTFSSQHNKVFSVPTTSYQNKPILPEDGLQYIDVYKTQMRQDSYQQRTYLKMCSYLHSTTEDDRKFGYTRLLGPLQALNIVYPTTDHDDIPTTEDKDIVYKLVGAQGLKQTMNSIDRSRDANPERYNFEYKPEILSKHGRIFSSQQISKYSHKIASICDAIRHSTGIVMIYSQFIDGGLIPMALALEEMGFTRYGDTKNLFAKGVVGVPPSGNQYVIITGDACFSKDNPGDLSAINAATNKYGANVKCVLISMAGAEGLDYKNIRQIHIMEPWYNMSRLEQIIGRGVRNLSHCLLPFEERNVEIYLHASISTTNPEQECIDLYFYRLAEKKAIRIGKVTRVLKQIAVDCLIHSKQHALTIQNMLTLPENTNIQLRLSSNPQQLIPFQVGDRSFSNTCDYMESCDVKCVPDVDSSSLPEIKYTYDQAYVETQRTHITERIRQLFKEQYFYPRKTLLQAINSVKVYPLEHIYTALTYLVDNRQEILLDRYGRAGILVNQGDVYLFQPSELNDTHISIFDRSTPVDVKNKLVIIKSNGNELLDELGDVHKTEIQLLTEIQEQIQEAFSDELPDPLKKNEWSYYQYARTVLHFLVELHKISEDDVKLFLVIHAIESMPLTDCLTLLQYTFSTEDEGVIVSWITNYLKKHMVTIQGKPCVPLCRNKILSWYMFENNAWKIYPTNLIPNSDLTRSLASVAMVGFIQNEVFKIKDVKNAKSKSAVAAQKGKIPLLKIVNTLLQNENVSIQYQPSDKKIDLLGAVVLLEMLMRYYGDKYFLTPEEANYT